jgi:hypothetical protein
MIFKSGGLARGAQLLLALLVATCGLTVAAAADAPKTNSPKADSAKSTAAKAQAVKSTPRPSTHRRKPAQHAVAKAQPVPAQQLPPVPAWLMNEPAVKPHVTFANGQLTIDAPNSTLSDVLSGVHQATGATLDGPTPTERVAIRLGPGTPGEVITALLEGTSYDYIILGETGHPNVISRIVLNPAGAESRNAVVRPAEEPTVVRPMARPPMNYPAPNYPAPRPADEAADADTPEQEDTPVHDVSPMRPELTQPAPKSGSEAGGNPSTTPSSTPGGEPGSNPNNNPGGNPGNNPGSPI